MTFAHSHLSVQKHDVRHAVSGESGGAMRQVTDGLLSADRRFVEVRLCIDTAQANEWRE
jgi:hypothetical protein